MKTFYKLGILLLVALFPLLLQSQDFIYEVETETECPIPCEEDFSNMEEIFDDETVEGGDISIVLVKDPPQVCPSTKNKSIKIKVTIAAATSALAKAKLKAYKVKHEVSVAMNNKLKTKFECQDCDLPDLGVCPKSVTNVKISFTAPQKVVKGKYRSTITVSYKAVCGECPLLILKQQSNASAIKLVSVYPNPGTNTINVKLELPDNKMLVQFRILDITGRVVKSMKITPTSNLMRQDIDIFNLEGGMYFLESTQGDSFREVTQFMKTK